MVGSEDHLQLTTPETRDYDTVFPGENWFFFWRTSPSLWESKLAEFQGPNPVFVPIFWGLHSENPDQWDFGTHRPETDLKKLYETARALGKQIAFLLPLSPAPFLPNGGLPSHLARTMVVNEQDLATATIDNDGRLNKLFSFFDPRVFQAFRRFTAGLGRFLSENAIACEIYGADSHYIKGNICNSFFNDKSLAFDRGFNRYLAQLKETGDLPPTAQDDQSEMEKLKAGYSEQIKSLYLQAAGETLAANWSGVMKFGFLGGAPEDIFGRSSELWEHAGDFFEPLFKMVTMGVIPSSVLLSPAIKKEPLVKALKDVVTETFIRSRLENELYEDDYSSSFKPIVFFELISSGQGMETLERTGLLNYLGRQYPWGYRIMEQFEPPQDEEFESRTRFFQGAYLDQAGFNKVLRLLMNGSKVFLDVSGMPEEFEKKLHFFTIENDLKVEKINYISPITKIKLGEGSIVTYHSDKLFDAPVIKKLNFWETLTAYLKIKHLSVQTDDQVFFFWNSRASNPYELDYEEIRRVSLYNTTSYKKKAHIVSAKNFAFLKTVDQKNVEVKSTPIGIDVQLLPGGSVSLDFGYYE